MVLQGIYAEIINQKIKIETTGLKHDGPIGKQLEDKRFILVGDRAYFSIEKVVVPRILM